MFGWKNKIELAAVAGRRNSFEVLNKLWKDSGNSSTGDNQHIIAIRPHTREQTRRKHNCNCHHHHHFDQHNHNHPSGSGSSSSSSPGTVVALKKSQRLKRAAVETGAVVFTAPASASVTEPRMSASIIMDSGINSNRSNSTTSGNRDCSCNERDYGSGSCVVNDTSRARSEDMNNLNVVNSEFNSLLLPSSPAKNGGRGNGRGPVVIVPMSRSNEGGRYAGSGGCQGQGEDRGNSKLWKSHGNHSMGLVLSALYAKLLVVMGIAFPLSEVMSTYIPAAYYDGFYLYLYFGSISFMIWVFGYIIRERARISARVIVKGMSSFGLRKTEAIEPPAGALQSTVTVNGLGTAKIDPVPLVLPENSDKLSCSSEGEGGEFSDGSSTESPQTLPDESYNNDYGGENGGTSNTHRRHKGTHFGSFYLRMGCVAFGVGSMIYSGLEFGQYFELKSDSKCHNYMMALTPSVRMLFTFMQMYFIFLSSRMALFKESLSSQFGLMHMIGTNLCVWFNVLVQETKHEILSFYDPDNKTISFKSVRAHQKFLGLAYTASKISTPTDSDIFYDSTNYTSSAPAIFPDIYDDYSPSSTVPDTTHHLHHRAIRGLKGPYSIHECGRTNIIGSIVQDAAPFLFPCTIEYSLICAAICYVMWKSMAKRKTEAIVHKHSHRRHLSKTYVPHQISKSPHHYTVDCAASHKGLFLGIFVLVLTIMSLIINFVLSKHPDYRVMANLEAHITEIVLYTMATCAVIIGMCQVRALRYSQGRNLELDNILLIVAQTGSLIFNIFAIISGQFILKKGENLVLVTALLKVIQLLLQTLFILDASKRVATTMEQAKKKPGREVITFLLITNLAMWLINALEKSRGESHPAQLQFYGLWCWTIITHFAMPLAIFYRFHSTVCLCEIWKRAYKIKHVVR